MRDAAFADFERMGFPSRKVERYKYTTIDSLFEPNYGLNINRIEVPVDPYKAFKCDVPNLSTSLYFIVNDQFRSALQPKENLPEGVVVTSLAEYAKENPEFVAKHYAQLAKTNEDAITALNTMLAQDGLLVYVKKNVIVDKTVQVINILRSNVALMVNRRVLIVMEEGASAKFLFCDHAADDLQFLTTQVIELTWEPTPRSTSIAWRRPTTRTLACLTYMLSSSATHASTTTSSPFTTESHATVLTCNSRVREQSVGVMAA